MVDLANDNQPNCNSLGSINVQVLNVRANYTYDFYDLNDGVKPPLMVVGTE